MLKINKIQRKNYSLDVKAQDCPCKCEETDVWVGNTNGNIKGCVKYAHVYTPKGHWW